MKHTRKFLALGLCLTLALSLGGCMSDPAVETPTPGSVVAPGGTHAPTLSPSPFANAGMRIALYTSPGTVDDQAHNAACYEGILDFIISRSMIDTVTPLQEASGTPASAMQAVSQNVDKYDVMVCVGSAFSELQQLAAANPDKFFILVDAQSEGEADNLAVVQYAEEQCGFFAGMAAAMETKSNRVAVVSSVVNDANTRYYYGFRSGVAYTNGNFGTAAEVIDLPAYAGTAGDGTYLGGNFTQNATDQSAGYALASSLMDEGCDVLFVAADTAGRGAFTAAGEREGVWVIGSETDQYTRGESNGRNIVLTSVTKNVAPEVEQQLNSIADNTFQGGTRRYTAGDNALGYVSTIDHQQMRQETLDAMAAAWPMMQDGTIVPGTGPQ